MKALQLCLLIGAMAVGPEDAPYFSYYSRIGLHAAGKWIAENGEKMAFKQAVQIECSKSELSCIVATATIIGGEPQVDIEHYEAISWDDNGLIAQDDTTDCASHKLIVNFNEKSVLAIDSPKAGSKTCVPFPTHTFKLAKR